MNTSVAEKFLLGETPESRLLNNSISFETSSGVPTNGLRPSALSFAASIIIIANAISITVIAKCKKMARQIKSLAINLNITDFVCGLTMFFFSKNIFKEKPNIFVCGTFLLSLCICVVVSLITITSFALDHALVLHFSVKYLRSISPMRVNIYCLFTWILGAIITYINFYDSFQQQYNECIYREIFGKNGQTVSNFLMLMFYVSNFILYIYVLKRVRQRSKWLLSNSSQTVCYVMRQQIRVLTKVLVITGTYFVMTTPNFIYNFLAVYGNIETFAAKAYHDISALIILCNSMINPFLFVFRFQECRFTLCRMMFFWNKKLRDKFTTRLSSINHDYHWNNQTRQQGTQNVQTVSINQASRNAVHPK